jgi:hypothetical protein
LEPFSTSFASSLAFLDLQHSHFEHKEDESKNLRQQDNYSLFVMKNFALSSIALSLSKVGY